MIREGALMFEWLFGKKPADPQPATEADTGDAAPSSFFSTDLGRRQLPGERVAALLNLAFPRTVKDSRLIEAVAQDGAQPAAYAMDDAGSAAIKQAYALSAVNMPEAQAAWYCSQGFIGYQFCAILAQHWLVNKACFTPARDAARNGFKLTANDGAALDPAWLKAIERANTRMRLRRSLVQFVGMGRTFGIRLALFVVESDDPEYYVKPFNPDGVTPGSYRGISQIDPYWVMPELTGNNASDPSAIGFYEPTYWTIGGKRYHKSHLVIMRGEEVADILKPSYLYGGISIPQKIFERVYAAERTANEAPQLALSKRTTVFYTDAAKAIANQEKFEEKLSIWAQFRDNFGVKVADKDADKVEQYDTSLADLDAAIMSQYQLVASAANVPVTKLLGTVPKGFNATGEYDADSYHEELESIQANDMGPLLERHLLCLIRSEIAPRFSAKPFDVEVQWNPLDVPTAKEIAESNKAKAETDKILVDTGAIDGTDVRARVVADPDSGYNGLPLLTDEDPTPNEEA